MASQHFGECQFQTTLKDSRLKEESKRETFEVVKCNDLFMANCERARQEEIAKREMRRRVAEENMMLASNKKRQITQNDVLDSIKADKETTAAKVTYSTMIR